MGDIMRACIAAHPSPQPSPLVGEGQGGGRLRRLRRFDSPITNARADRAIKGII